MGHPLKQTLVYALIRSLMDLQRSAIFISEVEMFGYKEVIRILKHTLISDLMGEPDNKIINEIVSANLIWVPSARFLESEYLAKIFKKSINPASLSDYFKDILSLISPDVRNTAAAEKNPVGKSILNEFIYRVVLSINRLETLTENSEIKFSNDTYMRILDRMLRIQSVPFSGEPLSGIQIMGILETRTLDFKNLIILSVNEGVLPAISQGSSFIPFSLREAFGLPSVNYQESIYAYHFYRLLQRAENVTFIYNSNSEGLRSGEMSRFLIQMKYEPALKPEFVDLNFEIRTQGVIRETLERTEAHSQALSSRFLERSKGSFLSPSAINTWLNCRMKFYYRYVNGLREPDMVSPDIDPAMLGSILHEIMKSIYQDFTGKEITLENLNSLTRDNQFLYGITNEAVNKKFKDERDEIIGGNELIVRDVLIAYLMKVINRDKTITPFTILNLENFFSFVISVFSNGNPLEIVTGGQVDRIDLVRGITRIVDYKTGSVAEMVSSLDELFTDDRKKENDAWLQIFLYCEAYFANNPESLVQPSVYRIKKMSGTSQSDKLKLKLMSCNEIFIEDYSSIRDEFISGLKGVISKIFSKDEPFSMTCDARGKCTYCPYKELCMR
jgi:CRISPR/Cas system-associated exonuclease Cas4 (RecB family)